MPSEKQIGIIGQYEPELCAVSARPVRGKHAVTHYQGDDIHYVRVLNQFDHLWDKAAPAYGFPVPEAEETDAPDPDTFVLEETKEPHVLLTGDNGMTHGFARSPLGSSMTSSASGRPSKATLKPAPADTSKGDD